MDEVVLSVAHEDVTVEFRRVRAAAVDGHAGTGVDDVVTGTGRSGRSRAMSDPTARPDLSPALDRADPEDRHRTPGNVLDGRRNRQERVPRQCLPRQDRLRKRVRLVASETVAPVVEGVAELVR